MHIIIFQSRATEQSLLSEQHNIQRYLPTGATFSYLSTLDTTLPWSSPHLLIENTDAVMFGGSGDYDLDGGREEDDPARSTSRVILERIAPLIDELILRDLPTLGICYGHQLIAELRGGKVRHDRAQNKIGTHEVVLTDKGVNDPLFKNLPRSFDAQYGHKDSVTTLPHGATPLAQGPRCSWSALRYGNRVYTTQFHPELTREDVIARLSAAPGYLPEGGLPEDMIRESQQASQLITHFFEHVVPN